jgi:tetratricopeptide (TPR) repeat protein
MRWLALFLGLALTLTAPAGAQDLGEKFQTLQKKLTANPGDLELKMDLAYLYSQGLAFTESLMLYEEVLAQDKDNLRATIETCSLYTQMRDPPKALAACRSWVRLAPQDFNAHDNLGLSLFKLGDYSAALKPFLTALSLREGSLIVRHHIGQVFLGLRELAVSRDLYREALQQTGTDEEKAYLFQGLYLA